MLFPEVMVSRRAAVVGLARVENGDEVGHRLVIGGHRPEVALFHHPAQSIDAQHAPAIPEKQHLLYDLGRVRRARS